MKGIYERNARSAGSASGKNTGQSVREGKALTTLGLAYERAKWKSTEEKRTPKHQVLLRKKPVGVKLKYSGKASCARGTVGSVRKSLEKKGVEEPRVLFETP